MQKLIYQVIGAHLRSEESHILILGTLAAGKPYAQITLRPSGELNNEKRRFIIPYAQIFKNQLSANQIMIFHIFIGGHLGFWHQPFCLA